MDPAPGKLAVAENGRGVEWAVCRITKNDGVLSGWRQVERHGRTHRMISSSNNSTERSHGESRSGCFVRRSIRWSGNIAGRGEQIWSLVDTPGADRNDYCLAVEV